MLGAEWNRDIAELAEVVDHNSLTTLRDAPEKPSADRDARVRVAQGPAAARVHHEHLTIGGILHQQDRRCVRRERLAHARDERSESFDQRRFAIHRFGDAKRRGQTRWTTRREAAR